MIPENKILFIKNGKDYTFNEFVEEITKAVSVFDFDMADGMFEENRRQWNAILTNDKSVSGVGKFAREILGWVFELAEKKEDNTDDTIINFETMGGWPVKKMNIRDILVGFGATLNKDTGKWEIPDTEKLDIYPVLLEDDGMGYGVNEQYVTEVNFTEDNYCSIFRESKLEDVKVWLESKTYPGDVIKVGDKEWALDGVEVVDGEKKICGREWLYTGAERTIKFGEKRYFTTAELIQLDDNKKRDEE